MKLHVILFTVLFFLMRSVFSQEIIQLHFATQENTPIDSVIVENLTQHTKLTTTTDLVNLYSAEIDTVLLLADSLGYTLILHFRATQKVTIRLTEQNRKILSTQVRIEKNRFYQFRLNHLKNQAYRLQLSSPLLQYSKKITGTDIGKQSAEQTTKQIAPQCYRITDDKASKNLNYQQGDVLRLTGFFGDNRTVKILTPTQSQTVRFVVAECVDADGNHYAVMEVGGAVWMVENLKTTTYRNGDAIPNPTDSLWQYGTTGAYRNVYDMASYADSYGRLYNWYAVNDKRGIAPKGWHVSTYAEWTTLIQHIATNDTLRNAMGQAAGYCDANGEFANLSTTGYWWLSSEYSQQKAWYNYLYRKAASVSLFYADKHHGFSVRLVKDKK